MGMLGLAVSLLVAASVLAQEPGPVRFDAVSIKRNTSNAPGNFVGSRGAGRFEATNAKLALLFGIVFGVREEFIIGAPGWFASDRFDVVATMPGGATPAQRSEMIRAMLADRFKLVAHRETRQVPVYDLILARADGRLGPDMKKSELDCAAINKAARSAPPALPTGPPSPGDVSRCNPRMFTSSNRVNVMNVDGLSMPMLVRMIEPSLSRPLIDRTGLAGDYDVRLRFVPEPGSSRGTFVSPVTGPSGVTLPPDDVPAIFTAVQEQLGLKIDPQRGPMEVLVIDSIERPTED
jgi:uncharacterized protein (TIGR03435 family)